MSTYRYPSGSPSDFATPVTPDAMSPGILSTGLTEEIMQAQARERALNRVQSLERGMTRREDSRRRLLEHADDEPREAPALQRPGSTQSDTYGPVTHLDVNIDPPSDLRRVDSNATADTGTSDSASTGIDSLRAATKRLRKESDDMSDQTVSRTNTGLTDSSLSVDMPETKRVDSADIHRRRMSQSDPPDVGDLHPADAAPGGKALPSFIMYDDVGSPSASTPASRMSTATSLAAPAPPTRMDSLQGHRKRLSLPHAGRPSRSDSGVSQGSVASGVSASSQESIPVPHDAKTRVDSFQLTQHRLGDVAGGSSTSSSNASTRNASRVSSLNVRKPSRGDLKALVTRGRPDRFRFHDWVWEIGLSKQDAAAFVAAVGDEVPTEDDMRILDLATAQAMGLGPLQANRVVRTVQHALGVQPEPQRASISRKSASTNAVLYGTTGTPHHDDVERSLSYSTNQSVPAARSCEVSNCIVS